MNYKTKLRIWLRISLLGMLVTGAIAIYWIIEKESDNSKIQIITLQKAFPLLTDTLKEYYTNRNINIKRIELSEFIIIQESIEFKKIYKKNFLKFCQHEPRAVICLDKKSTFKKENRDDGMELIADEINGLKRERDKSF